MKKYNHHSRGGHHTNRASNILRRKWVAPVIVVFLVILLIIAGTELIKMKDPENYEGSDKSIVTIGERKYVEKTLTTILFIGQDMEGPILSNESYNNQRQADFLALLAINNSTGSYSLLQINRDTMTDIDELGVTGELTGSKVFAQIALSHTYGDGTAVSCMNTSRAVSNLLYGVTIDYYISMSMDAVKELNDHIGGVTITLDRDYTDIDSSFVNGAEVTMNGEQALSFVKSRTGVDDETNLSRMERQKLYIDAFISKMQQQEIDDAFISAMYDKVASKRYIYTKCSLGSLKNIVNSIRAFKYEGISIPEGEIKEGKKYVEFYLDRKKFEELVTSLYFDMC